MTNFKNTKTKCVIFIVTCHLWQKIFFQIQTQPERNKKLLFYKKTQYE